MGDWPFFVGIGLFIFGFYALVTGKLPLNKHHVVRGAPARWLGALAMTALPVAFGILVIVGVFLLGQGQDIRGNVFLVMLIGAIVVFGCLIAVYAIGFPIAKRQNQEREADWEDADRRRRELRRWDDEERHDEERTAAKKPAGAKPPPLPKLPATGPAPAPTGLRFPCTGCGSVIEVNREHGGRKVRCPKCQTVQVSPTLAQDAVTAKPGGPRPTV